MIVYGTNRLKVSGSKYEIVNLEDQIDENANLMLEYILESMPYTYADLLQMNIVRIFEIFNRAKERQEKKAKNGS